MSENAFVAAIRPNVYGSSTSGVKKSIVCTTAASWESSVRRTVSVAISVSVYVSSDERHRVRLAPARPVGGLDDEALRIGPGVDQRDDDVALERVGVDRPAGDADRLAVAGGDRP